MKPLQIIFIYLALTISVLLVFWQVRNFGFMDYDDPDYVYENQRVTDGLTQDGVISAFTTAPADGNWLPLTWLSFMLDCQLFGPSPGRMHLVNVFFHLANTLLLFAVFKKMTGALWPSAFVAAAFALHPMHVESVAWITERKDVLSAFFLLLTLIAYAGYVKRPSGFRYAAALMLFAMGLMAKPMLVTLPFVLLLLDYWPLNRFEGVWPRKNSSQSAPAKDKRSILYRLIMEKVPFVALSVVSSVITFLVQRSGGSMTDIDILSFEARFANALLSYVQYIGKMFWPVDQAVFYPFDPADSVLSWQFTLYALLLLGVTVLVLFGGHRRKYLPVGWFWFVGTLIPVIGLVQVGSQAYADRYTYIPYIGLFIMIAWGLPDVLPMWPYRRAVLGILMVGVLTASGLCAHQQTGYWKDGLTLFSHALKATQNNFVMHNNLGAAYYGLGRWQEAIEAFKQTIRIKPNDAKMYRNLGLAYFGLGRYEQAIESCKQAIRIEPDYADTHYNLGMAYDALGRHEEAVEAYRQAIRIKPNDAKMYCNLGLSYSGLGRYEQAIESCKQAIRIKPDLADAYLNLGVIYGTFGHYEEAIEAYRQVIRIKPDDAKAYYNLGAVYNGLGRGQEAIEAFKQTIRIKPNDAEAYYNLGLAYSGLGRYQEAIEASGQAIRIKPSYAEAYNNLGIAYYSLGNYQQAAQAFGQRIRIQPENADAYNNLGEAYSGLKRYQEAIEAYRQAIRIKPQDADTHLSLGLAFLEIGDTAAATKEYEILKTLDIEMADNLFNRMNK